MISIIIPTHKGADLEPCLHAIKDSYYKDYEVIVVDEGLERSRQRNIGIERAKGEYLLILDSDQLIACNLLGDLAEKIKYCNAVYIPEVIITPGWFGRLRNWERQFYTGTPVDCVRFVRKNICPMHWIEDKRLNFTEGVVVGTFDESMSGPEDSDWDRRIPGPKLVSDSCFYHLDKVGVFSYFRKKAYYSRSMRRYYEKHPHDQVLGFWYRCFGVFLENGKFVSFFARPFMAMGVMAMIFIRGVIYLCARKY